MASRFENCLASLKARGQINAAQEQEVLDAFKNWKAKGKNDADAAMEASAITLWKKQQNRAQAAEQVLKAKELLEKAAEHKRGFGRGAHAFLIADKWGEAGVSAAADVIGAYRGAMHAKFAVGIDAYSPKHFGITQNVPGLVAMVREIKGEATGDGVAAAAARGWNDMNNFAADEFIAVGGALVKRERYFPNPDYKPEKIAKAGVEAFSKYLHDAYADGRLALRDFHTGEPADPIQAATIIASAVETLSSGGLNKLTPGAVGKSKIANKHADPRVLEWTTADAWLDAQRRWGSGDAGLWEIINTHINTFARDIGLMKVLGPNPAGMVRVLADEALKREAKPGKPDAGRAWSESIKSAYDVISGKLNTPVHEWIAYAQRQTGAIHVSGKLLSTPLSAVGDMSTLTATSAWNGLPVVRMMSDYVKAFGPGGHQTRLDAIRSGLEADFMIGRMHAAFREMETFGGASMMERVSDVLLRASGANFQASADRAVFQLGFLRELADQSGRNFDRLKGRTLRGLQRAGITSADWDRIKLAVHTFEGGDRRIYPELLMQGERADIDAGIKMLALIHREQDFAQVMADARAEFARVWGTQAGSYQGIFPREFMRFKSYSVSIITTHINRMIYEASGMGRLGYMLGFFVGMTAMGALAVQLKNIANGRDPQDMGKGKFWFRAAAQGGGLGIFGDYINAGVARNQQDFFTNAAGPSIGMINDLGKLLLGNAAEAAEEKNTNIGREAVRFLRNHAPGSSMWYWRKALDGYVYDYLQTLVDPDYRGAWQRTRDRAQRENHQSYWFGPGDFGPRRTPDFGRAIGQ